MNRSKTYSLSSKDIDKAWHVVDATDQTLGRLSTRVAGLLMGKHKPTYSPHLDMGDFVIIVNADRVRVTGKKRDDKIYYRHTGYIGGLKEMTLNDMLQRNPRRVIELSVRGMLPRNRLCRHLLGHLKVYAGPQHPHVAQVNASRKGQTSRRVLQPSPVRSRGNVSQRGQRAANKMAGVTPKKKRASGEPALSARGRQGPETKEPALSGRGTLGRETKGAPQSSTGARARKTQPSRGTAAAKTAGTKSKRSTGTGNSRERKA